MKSLRNLLYYLKTEQYQNDPNIKKEQEEICKKNIFDTIVDHVSYFSKIKRISSVNLHISIYTFAQMKPSEVCKLSKRFNESATGLYGLLFDNNTNVCIEDGYGNPYIMLAMSPKNYTVKDYRFIFYNPNGQGLLYEFSESLENDKFTPEHIKELHKLKEKQEAYYTKQKCDKERYEEIKKYFQYITVEYVSNGYAHCVKNVHVKKDIPIYLTTEEIAKYADDWNYCFGGSVSLISENEVEKVYRVRIHTD